MDDEAPREVALRAARGDEITFGELRQAVEPMVRSYLDQKTRDPTVVPALTDIVYDVARRALPKYPKSELHPYHWLLRVSRWVVLQYHEFNGLFPLRHMI